MFRTNKKSRKSGIKGHTVKQQIINLGLAFRGRDVKRTVSSVADLLGTDEGYVYQVVADYNKKNPNDPISFARPGAEDFGPPAWSQEDEEEVVEPYRSVPSVQEQGDWVRFMDLTWGDVFVMNDKVYAVNDSAPTTWKFGGQKASEIKTSAPSIVEDAPFKVECLKATTTEEREIKKVDIEMAGADEVLVIGELEYLQPSEIRKGDLFSFSPSAISANGIPQGSSRYESSHYWSKALLLVVHAPTSSSAQHMIDDAYHAYIKGNEDKCVVKHFHYRHAGNHQDPSEATLVVERTDMVGSGHPALSLVRWPALAKRVGAHYIKGKAN